MAYEYKVTEKFPFKYLSSGLGNLGNNWTWSMTAA